MKRVFYGGNWRSPDGVERERQRARRNNVRRVFGASGYLGYAPTTEQAAYLTGLGREFRDRQKQSAA